MKFIFNVIERIFKKRKMKFKMFNGQTKINFSLLIFLLILLKINFSFSADCKDVFNLPAYVSQQSIIQTSSDSQPSVSQQNISQQLASQQSVTTSLISSNSISNLDLKKKKIKAIVWDLDYTLVSPDKKDLENKIKAKIGYFKLTYMFATYLISGGLEKIINDLLFDVLKDKSDDNYFKKELILAHDPSGHALPKKFCDWLNGKCGCAEMKEYALAKFGEYEFKDFSLKTIIQLISEWMFDINKFSESMQPIENMVKIFKDCSDAKDQNGLPKVTLYILANWNNESFENLYKNSKNKNIFDFIKRENIFISGDLKEIKPKPEIFQKFLEKTNLNPNEAIFLDDQKENLEMAQKFGFNTILVTERNHQEVRKQLVELEIIS